MITLITGSPGSGKTLRMVSELAKTKEFEGRKIFVDGITGLKLGNIEPFPDGHGIADMHIWAKDPEYHGSVFVIDEAQRFFPKRSSNSKVPELLEFLHVHRHYGLDIYIITQMPTRIDKTVCDLVGAHYHIHKNRLGFRMQYYWDYCATSPKTESRHAQASVYRLDKNAFKLYESAQIHTKVKQPKSKVRWIIPLALCSAVYFSMGSYDKFVALSSSGKTGQSPAPAPSPAAAGGGGVAGVVQGQKQQVDDSLRNAAGGGYPLTEDLFKPTIPHMAESKPLYDAVRQVKTFEYATACIQSGKSCNCYSSQATKIKEIGRDLCLQYVRDGLPFNPYREPQQQQAYTAQESPVNAGYGGGSVLALSGHDKLTLLPDHTKGPSAQ